MDWRLDYILRPRKKTLIKVCFHGRLLPFLLLSLQLLEESTSVSGFVRDLTHLVDQLETGGCVSVPFDLPPVDYYTKITDHLAKVGWRK